MKTDHIKRNSNHHITRVLLAILFCFLLISIASSVVFAAEMYVYDIYYPTSYVALEPSNISVDLYNYGEPGYFNLYIMVDGTLVNPGQTVFYTQYGAGYIITYTFQFFMTAGSHNVQFCTDYNCLDGTWTWYGTPDLQLTDIYSPTFTEAGQATTITARIDNIGNADAGPYYVALYVDGQYKNQWLRSGLQAKYYTEFPIDFTGFTAGTHSIEFYADHMNNIAESNENNNYRTESFTFIGGIPDLQVMAIDPPTTTQAGQPNTITAWILNDGYGDAGPFYVALYYDGRYMNQWLRSAGLPAKSYVAFPINFVGLPAGTHSFDFYADHTNIVYESSYEYNNELPESFTFYGGTPDLELTNLTLSSSLSEGNDTVLTTRISNIGYADVGPFYLTLVIDGYDEGSWQLTPGVDAWHYRDVEITLLGGLPAGTHLIKIILDYYNQITELNETNNDMTRSGTWTASPPPSGVTAVSGPGNSQVTVSWAQTSNPYIDHYKIHYGTASRSYPWVVDNISADWNTMPISGLTPGTRYYFAVSSVNVNNVQSGYSNEASAIPALVGDFTPPSTPANLTVSNPGNGTSLNLNWSASTDNVGIKNYLVYRLTNNSSVSGSNYDYGFPKVLSSTSYADTGLSDSNTYYYKVQAVDRSNNVSGLSNLAYAKPSDQIAPSAPPSVGISAQNAAVNLWWSVPATNTDGSTLTDLAGYNIYRRTSGGSYGTTPLNTSAVNSYTDTGVNNGQTYYYVVKAVDDNGNQGPASYEVSGTPQGDLPPAAPTGLSITETETTLDLSWNRNQESDIAGYNVYRGTSSGSHPTRMNGSLLTGTWFVDTTASAGQTYYYVVTAVDAGGHESGISNEAFGKIGQGVVEIIAPTSANPLTIDFSSVSMDFTNALNEPIANIWGVANGIIRYQFSITTRIISNVYLEIRNSQTGAIVYTADEWKPYESDPYFTWSGKYKYIDKCAPDGWYDTKVYVKVLNFIGTYAETVRPHSIQITGCDRIVITTPADNPNPSDAAYETNFSFLSNSVITPQANFNFQGNGADMTWEVTGENFTPIYTPNDMQGMTAMFTLISPSHETYTKGNGSWVARPAFSYLITARLGGKSVTNTIKQDQRDIIREEYLNHLPFGLQSMPERTDLREIQGYGDFTREQIINIPGNYPPLAYSLIWGNPALLAQRIQDEYNRLVGQTLGLSGPHFRLQLNSSWRNPERNEKVYGVPTSRHQYGDAVDLFALDVPGLNRNQLNCILETAAQRIVGINNGFAEHSSSGRVPCDGSEETVTHVHAEENR